MGERTCDTVVIGGGIAGLSTAAALAADQQVMVLEAEPQLGQHATGRSAAIYLPSYGTPIVRPLTRASHRSYVELSEEVGSPLLSPRSLLVAGVDERSQALVEAWVDDGVGLEPADERDALALCPALRPGIVRTAGVDAAGMDIDVAGLQEAFRRRLRHAGGHVLTSAPVESIARRRGGWDVTANGRTVSAGVVVDAAGAWVDEIAALAGVPGIGLTPRRRCAFLSPIPAASHDHPDRRGWPLVADGADRWYFKPDAGGVLASPADQEPSPPCNARPDELEIARAIEAINVSTTLGLRSVTSAWAGLRSFVVDGDPVVGAHPDAPDFVFVAAQGGYGIQIAPALAELAAAQVLGHPLPPELTEAGITPAGVSPLRPSLRRSR